MATHSSILAWRITWTEEPAAYSPQGRKELDMTERLTLSPFHSFSYQLIVSVQFSAFSYFPLQNVFLFIALTINLLQLVSLSESLLLSSVLNPVSVFPTTFETFFLIALLTLQINIFKTEFSIFLPQSLQFAFSLRYHPCNLGKILCHICCCFSSCSSPIQFPIPAALSFFYILAIYYYENFPTYIKTEFFSEYMYYNDHFAMFAFSYSSLCSLFSMYSCFFFLISSSPFL